MSYIIPFLLAQGIYTGIVTGIGSIVMATCGSIKKIYTFHNPDVTKIVRKLDLERRLLLIQSILHVINEETIKKEIRPDGSEKTQIFQNVNMRMDINQDPIELCLVFLQQIIDVINKDLDAINMKIAKHNKKWFNSWRKLNIKDLLENLQQHSEQLDARFDDLTKISMFLKNQS